MCSFARGNCGLSWPTELLFGSKPKIANPIQKNVEDMGVLFQMCGLSFDGRKKEQVNWQVVGSLYTCFVQTTNSSFPFRRSFSARPPPHTLCGHSHPGSATSSGSAGKGVCQPDVFGPFLFAGECFDSADILITNVKEG